MTIDKRKCKEKDTKESILIRDNINATRENTSLIPTLRFKASKFTKTCVQHDPLNS